MVIETRIVPEGHSEIEQKTALDGFRGDLPPFSEPVECFAGLDRMGAVIVVNLRFSGVFDLECARCLEVYRERVTGELRVIVREEQGRHGAATGDDDEGTDFYFDVNHDVVDIGSAIYDEIMTSLPVKPLCSEDCGGITVKEAVGGGYDGGKSADPRWDKLKEISKISMS